MNVQRIAELAALFPPHGQAQPDGLLCAGGDLQPERLLAAYSLGIFPWYSEDEPILWWTPNPRCVMPLEDFHLPRRSARFLRNHPFELTFNAAFGLVIRDCARLRHDGTWITNDMIYAYEALHAMGYAHSVEAWQGSRLVGGLYGVGFGRAFFGESMFHTVGEASRAALFGLVKLLRQLGVILLDCQQETAHMTRMGAIMLPREAFLDRLREAIKSENGEEMLYPWRTRMQWDASGQCWKAVHCE